MIRDVDMLRWKINYSCAPYRAQKANSLASSRVLHRRNVVGTNVVCRALEKVEHEQKSNGLTYRDAGVDIDAGAELVKRIRQLNPSIGGFGGLYPLSDSSFLVAGCDGVGTKLKIAFAMSAHDTIGQDLVAMNVNDIITTGATPLFFLDYFGTGKLDVDTAQQVVTGISSACEKSGCVLLGGEV